MENNKTIGIDNGYGFTKTSVRGVIFKSTVLEGSDVYNANVMQVIYNNRSFIVGEKNNSYIVDGDKLATDENKMHLTVTTLTAIGLSFREDSEITVDIAIGTPTMYFENQRYGMAELFKGKVFEVEINKVGHKQTIAIDRVLVLPQALAPILTSEKYIDKRVTVIDVGSGTIDVAEVIRGKLSRAVSLEKGCMKLYSRIAQKINTEFNTRFLSDDVIDLIEDDYFMEHGRRHSTSEYIDSLLVAHTNEIIRELKQADFDVNGTEVVLIGGGARLLEDKIKDVIAHAEVMDSPQASNAESFHQILTSKLT